MADEKDGERAQEERSATSQADGTVADGNDDTAATEQQDTDFEQSFKSLQRTLRKKNSEAEGLRKRLSEFEDRDKTEQQRASELAAAAEKRARDAEAKLLRLEVAARKGLPAELALRLQGSTEDELEEDADALAKLIGDKGEKRQRRGDPDQGKGNGQAGSDDMDMNDWLRRAAGVRAE